MYACQERPHDQAPLEPSREHAEALAESWWEGFARQDAASLTALFAERATFWDPRFAPFAGRRNIGLYYDDLLANTHTWGGRRSSLYLGEAGRLALHTRSSFVFRATGKLIDFPMVAFFTQHAGEITSYEEYWDTGYVLRQLGIPAFPARLPF